jgi:hypothetical protein
MLTIVTSDGCDKTSPAQYLAPFRHFLFYRKETCSTLNTITLPKLDTLQNGGRELTSTSSNATFVSKDIRDNNKEKIKEIDSLSPVRKNEFSLFKRVKNMIEEKKSKIEEKRRIRSVSAASVSNSKEQNAVKSNSKEQKIVDSNSKEQKSVAANSKEQETEIIAQAQGLITCSSSSSTKNQFESFEDPFDDIDPENELLKTSTPLPSSPEGKVRNICFC